jgi:hypothetical protein
MDTPNVNKPSSDGKHSATAKGGNGHPVETWTTTATATAQPQPLHTHTLAAGEVVAMPDTRSRQAPPAPVPVPADTGGPVLRISLRDVLTVVSVLLTIAAVVWTLKSDIRDLKTTMDLQNKLTEERWQRQVDDMKAMKGQQTMQGLDINDLKIALAAAGVYSPKKPVTIMTEPQGGN